MWMEGKGWLDLCLMLEIWRSFSFDELEFLGVCLLSLTDLKDLEKNDLFFSMVIWISRMEIEKHCGP